MVFDTLVLRKEEFSDKIILIELLTETYLHHNQEVQLIFSSQHLHMLETILDLIVWKHGLKYPGFIYHFSDDT